MTKKTEGAVVIAGQESVDKETGEIMVSSFTVPADIDAAGAIAGAKALDKVKEFTDGMVFVKELYVPGKLVNLVVKPQ